MTRLLKGLFTLFVLMSAHLSAHAADDGWQAGVAQRSITPPEPIWMAGYAARTKPSAGKVHDLWVKAVAFQDPDGRKAVLASVEVCGLPRDISNAIRDELKTKLGFERGQIVLASTHTHSGPVVGTNLQPMYPLDPQQQKVVDDYAVFLKKQVVAACAEAVQDLTSATISYGFGRCGFAMNRRENAERDSEKLRGELKLKGPVDHEVPVLRADLVYRNGKHQTAIIYGYACHCTTLDFNKLCGDYAGFASAAIERANPGAIALYIPGCGGDQNPAPRRTLPLAREHGEKLAWSVASVLAGPLTVVAKDSAFLSNYEEINLPFAAPPTREKLEADLKSKDGSTSRRAKMLLAQLDRDGKLTSVYPYPITVWRLDTLTRVFLGGEVTVDYSLRLKRNLDSSRLWVSAYCNAVMCYIPSQRVLKEGGYEGATSMIYYGQPTVWADGIEERIIDGVARGVEAVR